MANPHGSFIWYELMTSDPDAANAFYSAVIGWRMADAGLPDTDYRLISYEGTDVAGMMKLPEEAAAQGMRPLWVPYIGVDDLDRALAAATAEGARLHMEPMDVPGAGRIAMVGDPQGIALYLMTPTGEGESTAFHPSDKGRVAWNELATPDQAGALDFYGRHFGFEQVGAMPMGDMGDYVFINHHGVPVGAVMTQPEGRGPGRWNIYLRVGDIDQAAERVRAGGGQVLQGPMEVPGGDFVIVGQDPQGAGFGLVGSRGA